MTLATGFDSAAFKAASALSSSALRAWLMALLTPPVSAGALGISARARLRAVAAALTSPFCSTIWLRCR
ncbi:Uncharacterised protein [Mycobacterium tuberculosis]|nr:Uncharacterised protein [Mycobacterium tuberculosis]